MAFVCQVTLKDHVIKALTLSRLWAELSAPTNFLLLFIGRFFSRLLKAFCSLNYSIVFKATAAKLSLQICESVNQF